LFHTVYRPIASSALIACEKYNEFKLRSNGKNENFCLFTLSVIRLRFLLVHHYRDLLYSPVMITQKTKPLKDRLERFFEKRCPFQGN
jgi:hypothetical protein